MMDNLIKILGVLDKPYHYFMVGLFLVVWKYFLGSEMDLYFWGGIFIVISLASGIERIVQVVNKKIAENKEERLKKENMEKLKNYYIDEYNKMNSFEKDIIDYCIRNNTLIYTSSIFATKEEIAHICSLVGKRFGYNVSYGGDFMMDQLCYDVLDKYIYGKKRNIND